MPPKRSTRLSAASAQPPVAKRQKRGRQPAAVASSTEDVHLEPAAAEVSPAATALPPELLDQLVTRVADDVSRRMSSTGGVPQTADALTEVLPIHCIFTR